MGLLAGDRLSGGQSDRVDWPGGVLGPSKALSFERHSVQSSMPRAETSLREGWDWGERWQMGHTCICSESDVINPPHEQFLFVVCIRELEVLVLTNLEVRLGQYCEGTLNVGFFDLCGEAELR